ncbi:MAG: carboxyl transferase domain-containing protein, partial [Synergistaceae bacterium]|nr:carboxyl transferase domain-containing protein [Synergistaceae bacterium]
MGERSINELCSELLEKRALIEAGGGQKAVDFQHSKGKLTARERIALLLDEGSFVEIDAFIVHRCHDFGLSEKYFPGDGVVTGCGTVDGRTVYVYAQDFTVIGGSLGEMHSAKICKIQDLALKNGAPCIGINDSGGARIQEGIDSLSGFGKIFFRNVKASGIIPQLSVIAGTCAGGAVYSPALTDFVFMINKTGVMHITGPAVIKAVTGESITSEEIGGASAHNSVSGCAHFYAENEQDCFSQVRKLLSYIPSNNMEEAPYVETGDSTARADVSLREAVPVAPNTPYDVRRVIETVFDNGEFFEVQPMFAKNIVTGFARLGGRSVGIIANQACEIAGCIDIDAADKAARFVRFCDAFNIPVVTFVDVPGFLPGREQEMRGIIRHGAKLIYAYSEATVPKITVI